MLNDRKCHHRQDSEGKREEQSTLDGHSEDRHGGQQGEDERDFETDKRERYQDNEVVK